MQLWIIESITSDDLAHLRAAIPAPGRSQRKPSPGDAVGLTRDLTRLDIFAEIFPDVDFYVDYDTIPPGHIFGPLETSENICPFCS